MDDNNYYWSGGGQVPMGGVAVEQSALGDAAGRPIDPDDWRAQLPLDSRQTIVNKIIETLKKRLPLSEQLQEGLKTIAVRFEENIYSAATSQFDYRREISLKMLTMETRSQSATDNSQQTNAANASSNSSDLASLDSTAQSGNTRVGDWQEEVYQEIKSMKDMYLFEMTEMYVKIATKLQQISSSLLPKQFLKRREQLQVVQSQRMKRHMHKRQMPQQMKKYMHQRQRQHRLFNSEQQSQPQQQMSAQYLPGHTMSPIPSPQFLQAASPQVTPQMDQQNLVAPLAPSQVNSNAAGSAHSLAMGTRGIFDSPFLAEFIGLDIGVCGNSSTVISGRSNTVEQAIDPLIKGLQKLMYTEEIDLKPKETVACEEGGLGGQADGADEDMNCI